MLVQEQAESCTATPSRYVAFMTCLHRKCLPFNDGEQIDVADSIWFYGYMESLLFCLVSFHVRIVCLHFISRKMWLYVAAQVELLMTMTLFTCVFATSPIQHPTTNSATRFMFNLSLTYV